MQPNPTPFAAKCFGKFLRHDLMVMGICINIMAPQAKPRGMLLTEQEIEKIAPQIGFFDLVKNMFSARTLPHIVMIGVMSSCLLLLVERYENMVSFAFISLSLSYAIIAIISNNTVVQKLIKLPVEKKETSFIVRFAMSFRITIVPILLSTIIMGLLWYGLGGSKNSWIAPLLASLFIVWSIVQAVSFRTGMVEWLSNGLGDAKLHTYKEKLSTASQFLIVQSFAFVEVVDRRRGIRHLNSFYRSDWLGRRGKGGNHPTEGRIKDSYAEQSQQGVYQPEYILVPSTLHFYHFQQFHAHGRVLLDHK